MTCVVALKDGGAVYIGGDSAGTGEDGVLSHRSSPKVFRHKNLLIGYSGSFRMAQIIQHGLRVEPPKKGESDDHFVVTRVIRGIRKCLAKEDFDRDCPGNLVLGYRGQIYEVGCEFDAARPLEPYCAIGSGGPIALGALYATADLGWSSEARITTALEAAARFNSGVHAPFTIESL